MSLIARALPPLGPPALPRVTARAFALFLRRWIAILITFTALPTTSAGRFSPRGPLGIGFPEKVIQLGDLPSNLLNASRRFVSHGRVWLISTADALISFQTFKRALEVCPILFKLASSALAVRHRLVHCVPLSI